MKTAKPKPMKLSFEMMMTDPYAVSIVAASKGQGNSVIYGRKTWIGKAHRLNLKMSAQ